MSSSKIVDLSKIENSLPRLIFDIVKDPNSMLGIKISHSETRWSISEYFSKSGIKLLIKHRVVSWLESRALNEEKDEMQIEIQAEEEKTTGIFAWFITEIKHLHLSLTNSQKRTYDYPMKNASRFITSAVLMRKGKKLVPHDTSKSNFAGKKQSSFLKEKDWKFDDDYIRVQGTAEGKATARKKSFFSCR
ncbi:hypothetical protein NPIL_678151 [Nephila pilipes]|uniref:Uncharacterized protein n=1 Tax=Nephila pilipes TaxID=299642 RepID=A0A8X6IFG6_NEPPI|nr:hypothetical protein NPIL_678151 [Nephila pilipes]